MFCYSCGNELPKGAKFCPKCGTEAKVKKIEKNTGVKSSNKVSKGYQGLPSDSLVQVTRRFKEMSKNKVLVALLACAIIIVGVQVFGGGSSSNSGGYSNDDYYDRDYQNNSNDDNDYDYDYGSLNNKSEMHCSSCSGSGTCRKCGGSGKDTVYVAGGTTTTSSCNYCYGSGRCRACGGDGKQ